MDEFEECLLEEERKMKEKQSRKSSFLVNNDSKERIKKPSDFIILPKEIKNKKALAGLHSFRVANDKLYK